jgi:hypothetical protein
VSETTTASGVLPFQTKMLMVPGIFFMKLATSLKATFCSRKIQL